MEQNILQLFGQNVRKERIQRKMSQAELANHADLHRTYIGMIERAEKNTQQYCGSPKTYCSTVA